MANWWDAPAPDPLVQPAAAGSSLIPASAAAAPPGLPGAQDNPYLELALARYQQLREQARVGLAAPVPAPSPAPAEPPAKPFIDVGNALSAAGTFLKQAPTSAAGALAQLYVGGDRPDTYPPYARSLIDAANQQGQENQARIAQSRKAGTADSVSESLLEASGSSGFSLASMLAGLGGFAAGSAAAGPVAGGATALAASGAASYRMAEAGLLDEAFKGAESALQTAQGRRMTEAEKADLYQKILPIAQNTGLWEAGPEAVGNALVAIGGGTALGFLGKDVIKGLAASAAKRAGIRLAAGAAGVGSEVATEGVTQYHQGNDQARVEAVLAGKSPETAERPYQGVAGLWQATKDVAPQTLALVGMMGLGAKAAHLAYRPMQQRAEAARAGEQATQHAELTRAALADLDETQLSAVIENARQALAGNPKMPATLRAQLHGVIAPLEADLQSRANGEAFRQAMADPDALNTARGQNAVLGMAHPAHVAQLSDAEIEAAGNLADELSRRDALDEGQRQAFSQAAQAYRQAATTRRQMQAFDAAIRNDPEAARRLTRSMVETVLGNPKEGITPEFARAALDESELTRHLSAAEGLLSRHADRMEETQRKALTQAREALLAEQEHRATQPDWQEQNAEILKNNAPAEVKLRAAFAKNPKKTIQRLNETQLPLIDTLIQSLSTRVEKVAKTGLAAPKALTEPLALLQARKAELEATNAKPVAAPPAATPANPVAPLAPLPAAPVPSLAEALQATPTGADPLAEFINQAAPGPSLLPPVPQGLPPSPPI
ncbi:MAG TPA: hypothetical protein PL166_13995, partial [Candidatus Contendobacter sp.]|nr:hypothetical protein [Candidatus Contendobacter sp.]